MARYESILQTIGHTPASRLNHLAPEGVTIYVKDEALNPTGSVKDRLAPGIIEAAEASWALRPGALRAAHQAEAAARGNSERQA